MRPVAERPPSRFVLGVTAATGLGTLAIGLWSLLATRSFADFADFGYHEHFLHDVGAFQIGLGAILLFALLWRDSLAAVLAGFLVGNTIHGIAHIVDSDLGGSAAQWISLLALSGLVAAALVTRLRQLVGAEAPTPRS
jgi:hypothetical protein